MNAQENDPLESVKHEPRKPKPTPPRLALVTLLPGKKPDPFSVLEEPTTPDVLANDSEKLTPKLVEAELPAASVACNVFGPEMIAGTVNGQENDPVLSVLHGLVNVIAIPPSVAVMLELAAKVVPFIVLMEPTLPEVFVNEISAR